MVRALAERQILVLERNEAYRDAHELFLGIVEGADVPPHQLMAMQNYTDLRDAGFVAYEDLERMLGRSVPRQGSTDSSASADRDAGGCSAWRVCHSAGEVDLAGQTWDMHATALDYVVLLHIRGEGGLPDRHALTIMGCPPLCGVTSAGLMVMINNVFSKQVNVDGLPWPYLVDTMLKQPTLEAARAYLQGHLPMSTHNYMLVGRQRVFNIEATGSEWVETHNIAGDGEVFHTNHCLNPGLAETMPSGRKSGTTYARFSALEGYLGEGRYQGLVSQAQFAEDVLLDGGRACVNVPRPEALHGPMTCGGLDVDLKRREARFFRGPYGDGVYQDLTF